MEEQKRILPECLFMIVGQAIVAAAVCGVYFLVSRFASWAVFSYKVVLGAALGAAVTVFNYMFLVLSVNRAVRHIMELRGTGEMDEEAAHAFAQEHQRTVQLKIQFSSILRTFTMLGILALALISDWFDPIATLIPLLTMRPVLTVWGLISQKK